MMPQTKRTSAPPATRRGFARAKSMALRIIRLVSGPLLGHVGGELKSVGDQFISRTHALTDFLHSVGSQPVGCYRNFSKLLVPLFAKDPVLVVQTHDRGRWHNHAIGKFARAEGGYSEHPGTKGAIGICEDDPDFCRACGGIEHAGNIGDLPVENAIRESVEPEFGGVSKVHLGKIVFENVTNSPDF